MLHLIILHTTELFKKINQTKRTETRTLRSGSGGAPRRQFPVHSSRTGPPVFNGAESRAGGWNNCTRSHGGADCRPSSVLVQHVPGPRSIAPIIGRNEAGGFPGDREPVAGHVGVSWKRFFRADPPGGRPGGGSVLLACLLYTSDAADE